MDKILHETQIFGSVNVYSFYTSFKEIVIEKQEHYQKRSARNRYNILTSNGVMHLSIPLTKGKNERQLISDVTISYDEKWYEKHLQSIRSAYGRSPYFEYYFEDIREILLKKHKYLITLNTDILIFILKKLKFNLSVSFTETYQNIYPDILDIRHYDITSLAGQTKYAQVWEGKFNFTPGLSILDLLFCEGPSASIILAQMNKTHILNLNK